MPTTQSVSVLDRWLRSLTVRQIRLVESLQPVTLPDGRRLRGVSLGHGLYLCRDRRIYDLTMPLTTEEVLQRFSVTALQAAWHRALEIARERRRGCQAGPP